MLRSLLLIGLVATPLNAFAATSGVIFDGTVDPTCTLSVTQNGRMTVNAALNNLSSKNAGGQAGLVSLSTTGGVTLSVDAAVSAVTAPSGDTAPTTWTPTYATAGTHPFPDGTASHALTAAGNDTVTVHLTGTKGGANVFAAGTYQATVTVRCEP